MHSTHCLLAVTTVFMVFHLLTTGTAPVGNGMYLPLNSTPTDIQVSLLDGSIVVSAGTEIFRLNIIDFTLNGSVTTHDHEPGHRIALPHNTSETILVCKDSFCTHYYIDWELGEFYMYTMVARGFDSVPLSVYPEGFYIGTSDGTSINIKHFNEEDSTEREYDWAFTNITFNRRKFLQGFQYGDFVYFVVQDNGTNLIANNVRVIRLCHDLDYIAFDAAYEAVLDCGKVSPNSKVEVSSNILNGYGDNVTVTIAVTTEDDTNICSFSIDDINSEMDASYDLCSSRDSSDLRIPLVWYNDRTCGVFSDSVKDTCNFDSSNHVHAIPALATFNSVPGEHLLQFNDSEEISAILSVRVNNSIDLLFVAYSTTNENHFLEKYYIDSDDALELVSREQHSLRIILLRWNEMMEEMYGANADSLFLVPLERCSDYTTCDECTRSNDPLCGWCALEEYCSRDIYCPRSSDEGHWVNASNQCIASVSLGTDTMDIDLIKKVELTINPQEAVLPRSPPRGYECGFYHRNHQNVSYGFTAPFSEGACQLPEAEISDFEGKFIELNFTIQIPNRLNISSTSVLTLHNCSLHTDCRACVEASIACGWCVYNRICTGNASICRHEEDWRSIQEDEGSMSVCPMIVTPAYTIPVTVERELLLSTVNVPPEIPGHRYGCVLKYKSGSVIELEPNYDSETEFRCLVSENQVHLSSDVANGTEATELELLWIRNSDNYTIALHAVKVTLYNCLELGRDCSSCLSANIGTGFECIWCDRQQREDECTIIDYCQTEATAAVQISGCPLPLITSISPKSGPTLGGTVVTINGSNLGAVASDVSVELIKPDTMKRTSCLVDETKYIPGTQIVCATQEASEGEYRVTVRVQRGAEIAEPLLLDHIFTYAHPIVNSIEPTRGPKAGRTKIMILGSNLDISSPGVVKVFIGDVECDIQSVASNMIVCVSRPVQQAPSIQRIRIHIDNADMPSEQFTYSENPIFTGVNPQNVIPAGGVTLSFKGNHLDVVLHPELIMAINNHTLRSACKPNSSRLLKCSTPRLPDDISINFKQIKRSIDILNYTIVMDGASGPVSTHKDLQMGVRPNPVFSSLNDKEYTLHSKQTISINGWNIDSVLTSELVVIVEDAKCEIADVTSRQVRCYPPDTIAAGDRHIKVFVGQNGLNYSLGLLRYKPARSGSSNHHLLLIIIPALAGVIVLMLTVLAVLCFSVSLLIHKRRKYKAKQRNLFNETDSSNVSTLRNVYNGNGHHEYDTIPDVLEQMQLQRMEMITCATHGGIPLNDISSSRQNHNIYYSEDEGRGSSASSNNFSSHNSSNTSGSRPLSTSTTGSVSVKSIQRPPLPPLPTSMSDEYIAMRSASDASLKNDARLSAYKSKLAAATTVATAALQELDAPDEQKKGPKEGHENVKETTEKSAEAKLSEHQSQESSA